MVGPPRPSLQLSMMATLSSQLLFDLVARQMLENVERFATSVVPVIDAHRADRLDCLDRGFVKPLSFRSSMISEVYRQTSNFKVQAEILRKG